MKLEDNREIWINRVNDFNASNLSQTTWAKNNGINVSALRYWLKKLDNSVSVKYNTPINKVLSMR